jgi:hypothetical protein
MTDGNAMTLENEDKEATNLSAGREGIPIKKLYVGPIGIVLMVLYSLLMTLFLFYGLLAFWPAEASQTVSFLGRSFALITDVRLIMVVAIAGGIGGQVHAIRSLSWYIGNRELVLSWIPKYILLPLVGASLALVFYFVIRAGFLSATGPGETNPFQLAALASLAGLFSDAGIEKLREVFETFLRTSEGRIAGDHVAAGGTSENGQDGGENGEVGNGSENGQEER